MGLYSGGLALGRVSASEIFFIFFFWGGGYFWKGLFLFFGGGRGDYYRNFTVFLERDINSIAYPSKKRGRHLEA